MSSPSQPEYDYEEKFQEELKKIQSNSLKQKLVAIKNIVMKRLALEREFKALNFQLEAKYENLYRPIYEKRAKVIEGSQEVTVDEVKDQLANLSITGTDAPEAEKGVPQFWLKCLKNTAQFSHINKKDEEVLSHLRDITCDFKENGTFTLLFHFNPNQYFDAPVITREFILDSDKLTISKIVSSKIEWKSEDLNPTVEKKKKKIKKKKEVKTVVKLEEVPSFFSFFKDYDVSKAAKKENKDAEEEEEDEDEMEIIEEEYDLGLFIKEELIPYAIEYYLGIIKDEYPGEEDEFGDDEEEESEEEEEKPRKGGRKK